MEEKSNIKFLLASLKHLLILKIVPKAASKFSCFLIFHWSENVPASLSLTGGKNFPYLSLYISVPASLSLTIVGKNVPASKSLTGQKKSTCFLVSHWYKNVPASLSLTGTKMFLLPCLSLVGKKCSGLLVSHWSFFSAVYIHGWLSWSQAAFGITLASRQPAESRNKFPKRVTVKISTIRKWFHRIKQELHKKTAITISAHTKCTVLAFRTFKTIISWHCPFKNRYATCVWASDGVYCCIMEWEAMSSIAYLCTQPRNNRRHYDDGCNYLLHKRTINKCFVCSITRT